MGLFYISLIISYFPEGKLQIILHLYFEPVLLNRICLTQHTDLSTGR